MKTLNHAALVVALACVSSAVFAKPLPKLRFGVEASYPPFESRSSSGQLQGSIFETYAKANWASHGVDVIVK